MRDTVGVVEDAGVVRDDDDRPPRSNGIGRKQLHDGLAARVIERRRRLVADDESRLMNERARNRDALLLPTGQRQGQRIEAIPQAEL